jgi:hypothetical protein
LEVQPVGTLSFLAEWLAHQKVYGGSTAVIDQDVFDSMIGRLDRILSLMIAYVEDPGLDTANRQTLKHHAEDMIGAGQKILKELVC